MRVESGEEEVQIDASPRIILVAPGFSKELTTSVLWLNDQGINVKCIEMKPHKLGEDVLLDVTQVIPLPLAPDYQIKVREKVRAATHATQRSRRERTVLILERHGRIRPGDVITALPTKLGVDIDTNDTTYRAKFAEDISRRKNVIWEKDGKLYSLSSLCEHMRDNYDVPFVKGGIDGYDYWALEGSAQSLWALAERTRKETAAESDGDG